MVTFGAARIIGCEQYDFRSSLYADMVALDATEPMLAELFTEPVYQILDTRLGLIFDLFAIKRCTDQPILASYNYKPDSESREDKLIFARSISRG